MPGYSRITDVEMKTIMKNAVDRVYALLRLKSGDPDRYAEEIAYGARCRKMRRTGRISPIQDVSAALQRRMSMSSRYK
jgi:hypothetical protein